MWVRGLKQLQPVLGKRKALSHPVWVRGLKHNDYSREDYGNPSHPVWVRGLKPVPLSGQSGEHGVAPRVGAWIETSRPGHLQAYFFVAPRVGAWIETPF